MAYLDVNADRMTSRASPLEENKKQAALLAKLLKSKDPNDLMKANRLIKRMAEADARKMEHSANIMKELDIVRTNIRLLTEMLTHFNPAMDGPLEQNEVIKDLYAACEIQRPKMFGMARELDQKEDILGEVLEVNDDLTRAMDLYSQAKSRQGPALAAAAADANRATSAGSDLLGGDIMGSMSPVETKPADPSGGLESLLDLDFGGPSAAPAQSAPAGNMLGGLGGLSELRWR